MRPEFVEALAATLAVADDRVHVVSKRRLAELTPKTIHPSDILWILHKVFIELDDLPPCPRSALLTFLPAAAKLESRQRREALGCVLPPQRTLSRRFRRELFFALHPGSRFTNEWPRQPPAPIGLHPNTPGTRALLSRLSLAAELDPVEIAQLGRYLSSLGYHEHRLVVNEAAVNLYLNKQEVLISYIGALRNVNSVNYPVVTEALLRITPSTVVEEAVSHFIAVLGALVYFGQAGKLGRAVQWRQTAQEMLHKLLGCRELSLFEKVLLESRFWRAACYTCFLQRDLISLLEESCKFLDQAENAIAIAKTEYEAYLAKENLFAALETHSRICSECGNSTAALTSILLAADGIDPMDTRVLFQAAELLMENGDRTRSLDYLLRAVEVGAPLGNTAWFYAGQIYEKLDMDGSAAHCYVASLAMWPDGASPIHRLKQLLARNVLTSEATRAVVALVAELDRTAELRKSITDTLVCEEPDDKHEWGS